ncbi:hypothetical protein K3N28_00070 [Glycomyces sp. TRM65418]|uniref:hypothetical protein n=1 Tax=Glycomyces sp. TRM65418 TaxID=2867006 RepID=UPI001CE6A58B|nr:hypothetical protein [Glycomyces sp. TRM65418]MCC3761475.1 hypothetical protein [Glycomyces sp. TRM65418]QZD55574.1 hypothetical protein K3N28_00075 [Glycomyces sp. TRM65418]
MPMTEEVRKRWIDTLDGLPAEQTPDPENRIAVEANMSAFLGNMWVNATIPEVQGVSMPELQMVAVQYFLNRADAYAAASLAAMTDLADTPGGRRAAIKALDRLERLGVRAPRWHGEELTLGECWEGGDVYGDCRTYFMSFHAPSGDFALSYTVDYSDFHFDMVTACGHHPDIEELLRPHRERNAVFTDRLYVPRPCKPEEVYKGTCRSLTDWDVFCVEGDARRLDFSYVAVRAMWKARMRMLPQMEVDPGEMIAPTDEEQGLRNGAFLMYLVSGRRKLDEPHMKAIDELCWFHGFNGFSVSPVSAFVFLERYLPAKYEPRDPVVRAVKELMPDFVTWAGNVTDVPLEAMPYLEYKTEQLLKGYPRWKAKDEDISRTPRPRSL